MRKEEKVFSMPKFNSPKNWTEDYSNESGNYLCHCFKCKEPFYGKKRRYICKECYEKEDTR